MRGSKKALRALTAGALMATGLAVTVNPAAAGDVACGAIITEDTTLHEDVGPCTGDGLVVTASDIVVDLGGFSVTADNGDGDNAGIRLVNVTGVTITNGMVEGFDAGVLVVAGSGNTVVGMSVENNVNDFSDELGLEEDCTLGDGIALLDSSGNTIGENDVVNNGPYGGITMIGDSDDNVIERNSVRGNNIISTSESGCGNTEQDEGIRVEGPGAQDNVIKRNTVLDSLLSGIGLHGYVCGEEPFEEPNTGTVISMNVVRDTAGTDIATGINFLQQGPAGIVCPAFATTVERNKAIDNQVDGIFVAASSADNVITRNVASRNDGDGVHLGGPRLGTTFENLGPSALDVTDPDQPAYVEDVDYAVMFGSGSGDVTVEIEAIDLAIPNDDPINPNPVDTSTSACETEDFADFTAGSIALIQRGTCTFVLKVDNAIAAGASAVVMFNEGQEGRTTFDFGSVGVVGIPVLSAEYGVGQELANLIEAGPTTVNVETNTISETFEAAPGAHDNTLIRNTAQDNTGFGGFDGNLDPPCDANLWSNNVIDTVNQACVDGDAVIPPLLAQQGSGPVATRADVSGIGRGGSSAGTSVGTSVGSTR